MTHEVLDNLVARVEPLVGMTLRRIASVVIKLHGYGLRYRALKLSFKLSFSIHKGLIAFIAKAHSTLAVRVV